MQLVQHNPSLQKPCDPILIGKQVIYIVLWDEIFTKAAKPKALAQTPTAKIWGFERRGLHQTSHFISLHLDCVLKQIRSFLSCRAWGTPNLRGIELCFFGKPLRERFIGKMHSLFLLIVLLTSRWAWTPGCARPSTGTCRNPPCTRSTMPSCRSTH